MPQLPHRLTLLASLALSVALAGCARLPTFEARTIAPSELQAAREQIRAAGQLQNGFPRRLNGQLDEDGKRQLRTFIEGELALR